MIIITDESCAGIGSPPAKRHCPGICLNSNYIMLRYYETISTGLQNIHAGELMTSEGSATCK